MVHNPLKRKIKAQDKHIIKQEVMLEDRYVSVTKEEYKNTLGQN